MIARAAILFGVVALAGSALPACTAVSLQHADAMSSLPREPVGEDRLSLRWKFVTAERLTEIDPQEFAVAAVSGDWVFIGSQSGMFFALNATTGAVRWKSRLGAVTSQPVVVGSRPARRRIRSTGRSAAAARM